MAQKITLAAAALGIAATGAHAGGVERSNQSVRVLFETGTYAEFSLGSVSPTVSGSEVAPVGADPSGDMAPSYSQSGFAFRNDLNDRISYAVIFDRPYGADVDYPVGTGYFAQGSVAKLRSNALTALFMYTNDQNVSFYGGPRIQTLAAQAVVPFIDTYGAIGEKDEGYGYVLGAAYQIPDIALRVSLTYNSPIEHQLATTETTGTFGGGRTSTTTVDSPQSLNLEFQTGIAQDTLLFGSVRWVDWSEFDISPNDYGIVTGGGSLVSYDNDTISYALGLGRRLSDVLSVSASIGYEGSNGGFSSNLGPTDGNISASLGAQYRFDNITLSGGLSYVEIGDAQTTLDGTNAASSFTGNSAIGAGIRVGIAF